MLEQKDFDILKNMMETVMDEKLAKSEEHIMDKVETVVDEKLAKSEDRMMAKVDKKLTKSENLILDELERTRNILENRIEKVEKNLDELNQYYRISKLENDNIALLLKMSDDLSRRIEKLENRTA